MYLLQMCMYNANNKIHFKIIVYLFFYKGVIYKDVLIFRWVIGSMPCNRRPMAP